MALDFKAAANALAPDATSTPQEDVDFASAAQALALDPAHAVIEQDQGEPDFASIASALALPPEPTPAAKVPTQFGGKREVSPVPELPLTTSAEAPALAAQARQTRIEGEATQPSQPFSPLKSTYVSEQAAGLVTQAVDFFPAMVRGLRKNVGRGMNAILGEKNADAVRKYAKFAGPIPALLAGDVSNLDAALDASGHFREGIRQQLQDVAIQKGGKAGAITSGLVEAVEGTLMTLWTFKAAGIGYGTGTSTKGVVATVGKMFPNLSTKAVVRVAASMNIVRNAMLRSGLMTATTEQNSMKDAATQFGIGTAYQSTPAFSRWMKNGVLAKVADVAANFGISATQVNGTMEAAKQAAIAEGHSDRAGLYQAISLVKMFGSDVVFGLMTNAYNGDPKIAAEIAKIDSARTKIDTETEGVQETRPPAELPVTGEEAVKPPVDLPVTPENERQTITRAAEGDKGQGPLSPAAQQLRDQERSTRPTAPMTEIQTTARDAAVENFDAAVSDARAERNNDIRVDKLIGILNSGKGTVEQQAELLLEASTDISSGGRMLRSARELMLGTPAGRAALNLKLFEKWMERNKVKVKPEILEKIRKDFQKAEAAENPEKEVDKAILRAVHEVPSRKFLLAAFRYSNVLSSPRSHLRNLVGNMFQAFVARPLSLVGQGKPGQALTYAWNSAKAIGEGWGGFKEAMRGEGISKLIDVNDRTNFDQAMQRRLPLAVTLVGRMMEGGDRFLGAMIEAGESARLQRSGMAPAQAQKRANALREQYLFRQDIGNDMKDPSANIGAQALDAFGAVLEYTRRIPVLGAMMRPVLMFIRTPVSIAKEGTKFSLLGFTSRLNLDKMAQADYGKDFKNLNDTQKAMLTEKRAEVIGMRNVGVGITVMGVMAALSGRTTWAAPKDEKEREMFYASGRKPYSINIDGKWIPIWTMGPLGLSLAVPAAMRDVMRDNPEHADKNLAAKMAAFTIQMANFVIAQTPFSSMEAYTRMMGGDEKAFDAFMASLTQQMIPASGFLRYVNNFVDPTFRRSRTIAEKIRKGIPGASKDLPAYMNPDDTPAMKTWWDRLPPFAVGIENDIYEKELGERTTVLKDRKEHNMVLDELISAYRSDGVPIGEITRYVDGFKTTERSRLKRRVKEYHGRADIADRLPSRNTGSGGFGVPKFPTFDRGF